MDRLILLLLSSILFGGNAADIVGVPVSPEHKKRIEQNNVEVVGVKRDRLTHDELYALQHDVIFSNEDLFVTLDDNPPISEVGYSGTQLPTVDVDPNELDIEGDPIGFNKAKHISEDAINFELRMHYGNANAAVGDWMYLTFYVKVLMYDNFQGAGYVNVEHVDFHVSFPKMDVWYRVQLPVEAFDVFSTALRGTNEGAFRQHLYIGGVKIENFRDGLTVEKFPEASLYYGGMEPNASWRDQIEADIEATRKGTYTVKLVSLNRVNIANQRITIEQVRHEFNMGAVINRHLYNKKSPERFNAMLEQHTSLYNIAGMENFLKWRQMYAPSGGDDYRDHAFEYWKQTGTRVRGHAIQWPKSQTTPDAIFDEVDRLRDMGDEAGAAAYLEEQTHLRTADAIARTKDLIHEWDVINELPDGRSYFGNGIINGIGLLNGTVQLKWLDDCERLHPGMKIFVNDYRMLRDASDDFGDTELIGKRIVIWNDLFERAIANGNRIDAFGLQGHFKGYFDIWALMERVRRLPHEFIIPDLMFEVTEFDLKCFDDESHAQFIHDLLSVLFAHPKYSGFMMWRWLYYEGMPGDKALMTHNTEGGGFFLSGAAIHNFFHYTHWTHPETKWTDDDGKFTINAYHGVYKITVDEREFIFPLYPNSTDFTLLLDFTAVPAGAICNHAIPSFAFFITLLWVLW